MFQAEERGSGMEAERETETEAERVKVLEGDPARA